MIEWKIFNERYTSEKELDIFCGICEYYYSNNCIGSYFKNHILRVVDFSCIIYRNIYNEEDIPKEIYAIAYGHDLIEDTDFADSRLYQYLTDEMKYGLDLTTRTDNINYFDYINKIKREYSIVENKIELKNIDKSRIAAYCVKLADLFDHISKIKTLNSSLKERYLKALDVLLQ